MLVKIKCTCGFEKRFMVARQVVDVVMALFRKGHDGEGHQIDVSVSKYTGAKLGIQELKNLGIRVGGKR